MKSSRLSPAGRLWGGLHARVKAESCSSACPLWEGRAGRGSLVAQLPLSWVQPWDCGREGSGPTVGGAQRPRKQAAVGTRLQAARAGS